MARKFIIGTRGSLLAIAQADWVCTELGKIWKKRYQFEIKIVKTTGDALQKEGASAKLPKGLFTKEIEVKLAERQIDLAVHSCKDLPTDVDGAFCIASVPQRLSAKDVLISKSKLEEMPKDACVLTGSPRRKAQWLELHPMTKAGGIRGNIDTRVRKLRENDSAWGLILAEAGLLRRSPSLEGLKKYIFSYEEILPAPGQGALAIEARSGDDEAVQAVRKINDTISENQILAERSFLRSMGGGCRAAIGAYAEPLKDGGLNLFSVVYGDDSKGKRKNKIGKNPEELGKELSAEYQKL